VDSHINKDHQDLIPPLKTQEYNKLKESINDNGQRIPIIITDRTGQLLISKDTTDTKYPKNLDTSQQT
jgi:hypothetical protein